MAYLNYKTSKSASDEALYKITQERSGEQFGLLTTYDSLNIGMGKYFRFGNVNLWGGLSGHGKSYLINKLNKDFTDFELNSNLSFVPVILHFGFEMSASDEILRNIASDLGVSYQYLLSSQYDKDLKDYNRVNDTELTNIKTLLKKYQNRNILYFENAGNVKMIYATVENMVKVFKDKSKTTNLNYKFVVNVDHTLLIKTLGEKDNLELMSNVGRMAISLRKDFDCMVNLVGQLNNKIEDVKRLSMPPLHYPQKSDIYAQGQVYNACDNVFVIHQPSLLKITQYGNLKINCAGLVHLIKLKSRHGNVGSIWFENQLHKGRLVSTDIKDRINTKKLPKSL